MMLLTQIAFEIGIEEHIELLEKHLAIIQDAQGEEAVVTLRHHLFEE
jgi:hypothetical protein